MRKKKIAFFGLKGMPPRFGGLQFDAEEIGVYLVKKGYEVIVFCRKWYQQDYKDNYYKGMKLKVINSPKFSQFFDVTYQTLVSIYLSYKEKIDVAYLFGAGSYFAIPILRLLGIKTIIRRNGFAIKTNSYNIFGRYYLALLEFIGIYFSDIITTETAIEKNHAKKYVKKPIFITPVGISIHDTVQPKLIAKKYNLQKNDYILFIGRLVRVKRVEWLIKSFLSIMKSNNLKLVIAGSSDDTKYIKYLRKIGNNKGILFTGYVDGRIKDELISNPFCMVLPSKSEGMSTAVMETLSYGGICVLSDIDVHKWILNNGSIGILFNNKNQYDLTRKLEELVNSKYLFNREEIQKKTLERFEKEKILNKIHNIIESIV